MTENPQRATPSRWIARFASLIAPGGAVLDVACGTGRHADLLRGLGYTVTAIDRDISRLGPLADDPGVEVLETDLEDGGPWPLGARRFAGVVVANYLHRPLLPALIDAVDEGGVLIYETFAAGNEQFGRPSNPDFLLRPGELLAAVAGELTVIAYECGAVDVPNPAVIQRICARRGDAPAVLNA
ncbi:MAG: methyltransferase domain-containing protein [Alphaproteobacteria bacterium]